MNSTWQKLLMLVVGGAVVATVGISATLAQEEGISDEGTVVRVGPDGGKDPLPAEVDPRPNLRRQFQPWLLPGDPNQILRQRRPASPYYIGVAAEKASDQLRAHIDLPDGVGLVVLQVFEGSPADEGGLKEHDILVAADGTELRELDDLINVVKQHSGEQMTQFTLDVIRSGQPQTLWVTPAERPQPEQLVQPGFGGDVPALGDDRRMFDRLLPGGGGFGMQGFDFNDMPGNVSVQMQKQGDEPTKITVQRDGETWVIEGDDPGSLNELPEDLRPMVERMLRGQTGFGPQPGGAIDGNFSGDLRERMRQMEEQMRQMQEQMFDGEEQ
jgi:membrane-associated protease RseP (regulator of RpoE activity)